MNTELNTQFFDRPTQRRNTNSYKWDTPESEGVLPLWVADMDFQTAPAVTEALRRVVDNGIFGYTYVPEEFYEAASAWFGRRHGYDFTRRDVIYTSGVVPAVSAIIKAFTRPGDEVALCTPAYNCFFSSIRNNGCHTAECQLKTGPDGKYEIDFDALEGILARESVKIFILCNPHNPGGRVWTRTELRRLASMCSAHGVMILSDDIHCELVYAPNEYTPIASLGDDVADNVVTCISPSKAFNTAGLQIALIVTRREDWRRKIDRAINDNEVCDVNPFGIAGLIAAYTEGEQWLEALVEYLNGNRREVERIFAEKAPQFPVMPLEATYLAWVDVSVLGTDTEEIERKLHEMAHVRISPGAMYHSDNHIRINFACQRSVLVPAVERIAEALAELAGDVKL